MIIGYINRYKNEYGVEQICRVLTEHGCPIAPSTYYEARNRSASRRTVRDEEMKIEVSRVHAENYRSTAPERCGWKCGERASTWRGARSNG